MIGLPLRRYWRAFCCSSAPARFVFGLLCAPRSPLNSFPPVLASNSPPRFPQGPFRRPKCTILCCKTNDFAKTPVCPECSLRAPLGPPRVPRGPPRGPQGRSRAPQGAPQEPLGGAWGPPRPPPEPPRSACERPREARDTPGTPKITASLPKSSPRTHKVPQSHPQEVMYQLRAGAWCACFTGETLF